MCFEIQSFPGLERCDSTYRAYYTPLPAGSGTAPHYQAQYYFLRRVDTYSH